MYNGWTPYTKPSAGGPNKHMDCRDRWTCTSHDTPVMYPPAGCEVCAGQHLSMTGRQSSLHKHLSIGKFPQPGPYTGPYWTKAHTRREWKQWWEPERRPNPLSCHPPGRIPPIYTGVLTQRPPERKRVARPTGARQHRPRGPSTHQDSRPQSCLTGGRQERQNKLKPRKTNGRWNRVTQSVCWPRQWCHVSGKYWRERRWLVLCRVVRELTYDPGQHAGPWGIHQWTGGHARGCRGRYCRTSTTNGTFSRIDKIELPELDNADTNSPENHQDNGTHR